MKNAILLLCALLATAQITYADTTVTYREGTYTLSSAPLKIDATIIENPDSTITIISPTVTLGSTTTALASESKTGRGLCSIFGKALYSESSINSTDSQSGRYNLMLLANGAVLDYGTKYYDLFSVTCR